MWWPTREDLEALQREIVAASGGEPGVLNPNALEAALVRPLASAFGEDAFPGVEEKVAVLMHSIVTTHAFVDGNKRTGATAGVLVLRKNGRQLVDADVGDLETLALALARGEMNVKDVIDWFRCRLK